MSDFSNNNHRERLTHFIAIFSSIWSHEQANSLITRHFPLCKEVPHKTDCIVKILTQSLDFPDRFFSNITAITRLHSNAIERKPSLLKLLNNELKIIGLMYDQSTSQLTLLDGFQPYLTSDPYITIDFSYLPDQFYKNLVREINWCYSTQAYTATLVLIRKLFENLTLDLLRKKFQNDPTKGRLYWKNDRFVRFVTLIQNLDTEMDVFGKYSPKMDQTVIDFLNEIRIKGNISAHTIEEVVTTERLELLKTSTNQFLSLLTAVLQRIV